MKQPFLNPHGYEGNSGQRCKVLGGKGFPPGQMSGFVHLWAINERELREGGEGFMRLLYLE